MTPQPADVSPSEEDRAYQDTKPLLSGRDKMDLSGSGKETPLPRRIMLILMCVILSEPMSSTVFFPFMFFMVSQQLYSTRLDSALFTHTASRCAI
jgi:hypothetical protein